MAAERVREFLDEHGVGYDVSEHPTAFTAQEVAAAEHVPGRQVAKPVMLSDGDRIVMVVLPATRRLDLSKAEAALGAPVRLAEEREFTDLFPDCQVGAEPPFGHLYDVPVYLDRSLLGEDELVFPAGDYTHTIHMALGDYLELAGATEVDVAEEA